jgi:hypothetical protein
MTVVNILKGQYANDVFTTEAEAVSRSSALGLGGDIHVHSMQDGQGVYMPAASHEMYMSFMQGSEADPVEATQVDRYEALRVVIQELLKSQPIIEGKILKVDDEQRLVYGWASVVTEKGIPVVDRQGDVIGTDTLVSAINEFMEHVRVGKAMHTGEQVGVIVHSLPVTAEICSSLGIASDREGWVVAYKVYDDEIWAMVKSGELAAFSIGGRATMEEI